MAAYWMTNSQAKRAVAERKKLKPVNTDIIRTMDKTFQVVDMGGNTLTILKGTKYKCVGLRDSNGYAATFEDTHLGTRLFESAQGVHLV